MREVEYEVFSLMSWIMDLFHFWQSWIRKSKPFLLAHFHWYFDSIQRRSKRWIIYEQSTRIDRLFKILLLRNYQTDKMKMNSTLIYALAPYILALGNYLPLLQHFILLPHITAHHHHFPCHIQLGLAPAALVGVNVRMNVTHCSMPHQQFLMRFSC